MLPVSRREVRRLGPDAALLRALAGMLPPGSTELDPATNAHQTIVAERQGEAWRITLFQNTPAQYHGRPHLVEQDTAELSELLKNGAPPSEDVAVKTLSRQSSYRDRFRPAPGRRCCATARSGACGSSWCLSYWYSRSPPGSTGKHDGAGVAFAAEQPCGGMCEMPAAMRALGRRDP